MVKTVLHVLLECFMELCDRMEKYSNTVGHCVSVIMALFELMAPRHYHLLRNSLHSGEIPNIDLEVCKGEKRERILRVYPVKGDMHVQNNLMLLFS